MPVRTNEKIPFRVSVQKFEDIFPCGSAFFTPMRKITFMLLGVAAALAAGICLSGCKCEKDGKKKKHHCDEARCCVCSGTPNKVLSSHDTKAVFRGRQQMDDSAGDIVFFDITSYEDYVPESEYADPQLQQCAFVLPNSDTQTDPEVSDTLDVLQPGDEVSLEWDQVYITDPQTKVSFPRRIIRKIERLFEHKDKTPSAQQTEKPQNTTP